MTQGQWLVLVLCACAIVAAVDPFQRLAVRWATASLNESSPQVQTPFAVYLRSFDEDGLRLPFDSTRAVLHQYVSPVRRYRFEELVAATMSQNGTLVAVSPPEVDVIPVGAMRVRFDNDLWQEGVDALLEQSRAVLMSATPDRINSGLAWETEAVARTTGKGVALILGPWPLEERLRRFNVFSESVKHNPYFDGITDFDPRITLILFRHRGDWRSICADTRDDVAYAYAVATWLTASKVDFRP